MSAAGSLMIVMEQFILRPWHNANRMASATLQFSKREETLS